MTAQGTEKGRRLGEPEGGGGFRGPMEEGRGRGAGQPNAPVRGDGAYTPNEDGGAKLERRGSWANWEGDPQCLMWSLQSHMNRSLGPALDTGLQGKRSLRTRIPGSRGQVWRSLAPS